MSLSSYNGKNSFTIKGKKFLKRGANNIYDIASVAGTSGNFSTGWVQTDGTTPVSDGATLTFNHNLGTTDVTIDIYVSDYADGSSSRKLNTDIGSSGTEVYGPQIQNVTASSLTLQLSSGGYIELLSNGTRSGVTSFSGQYIKVVASAGGGMARASGMIIRRNNSNYAWDLMHGVNVASMSQASDSGTGRYGYLHVVYTITLETPLANPTPIVSCAEFGSYRVQAYNPFTVDHKQAVSMSNSNINTVSTNTNTAYENQEFDTLTIEQAYNLPAFTSFVIF